MAVASAAADASPKAGPAAPTVALTDATGALSLTSPEETVALLRGRWVDPLRNRRRPAAGNRSEVAAVPDRRAGEPNHPARLAGGGGWAPLVCLGTPLLLYALGGKREKQTATRLVNALVTSGLITETTKVLVGRRRPDESGGVGDVKGPSLVYESFPSGHTSAAFAMATVLATQYPRYRVPLYALAAAVAASRVRDRHFRRMSSWARDRHRGRPAPRGGSNLLGFIWKVAGPLPPRLGEAAPCPQYWG